MSYINIIMPLSEFYPYIQHEIEKYQIEMAIEYFDSDHKIQMKIATPDNLQEQLSQYDHPNLGFYFLDQAQYISKDKIYKDEYCIYAIAGKGGRETEDTLEKISLRIISKTPDKNIKSFFNAIKRKLNNDENFGKGVQGGSRFHDQHFYLKSWVGHKVFKSDLYNEKSPLITPK